MYFYISKGVFLLTVLNDICQSLDELYIPMKTHSVTHCIYILTNIILIQKIVCPGQSC